MIYFDINLCKESDPLQKQEYFFANDLTSEDVIIIESYCFILHMLNYDENSG